MKGRAWLCIRTLAWSERTPSPPLGAGGSPVAARPDRTQGLWRIAEVSHTFLHSLASAAMQSGASREAGAPQRFVPLSARRDLPCQHGRGQSCHSPASLWDGTRDGHVDGKRPFLNARTSPSAWCLHIEAAKQAERRNNSVSSP